ncbi:MAG: F0F1 ATP synthase subunit B, partial [Opitutus sp.]
EKKIAAELADAATKKAEAAKDRDEFQKKNEDFDRERSGLLQQATDEASTERRRLLDEARKSADELSAKRQEKLHREAATLSQTLARRTQQAVFGITRKTLTDLASAGLEERMVARFAVRLREMDTDARKTIEAALKSTTVPAIVRTTFGLSAEEQATVQHAINEAFSIDAHLRFETAPDLISGIELTANGQKVSWSIADYLTSLGKSVDELLLQQDKLESKTSPQVESKEAAPGIAAKTEPKPLPRVADQLETKTDPKAENPVAAPVIS